MKNKIIYLIRHGEIELYSKKRYIGSTDLSLTDKGIKQAYELKKFFDKIQLEKVYCSDLERSRHTAGIILQDKGGKVKTVIEKGLREIHMGQWEAKTFEEIQKTYPDQFIGRGKDIFNFRPPGGESFLECNHRVMDVFKEITYVMEGNILIVGHAGVNRLILSSILDIPQKNLFIIKQDYGCLNEIVLEGLDVLRLKRINCVCCNVL